MRIQLTSTELDQVHGGAALQGQASTDQFKQAIGSLTGVANPRDTNMYQPDGASFRVEYPQGFRPNGGDANSWRTIDNATGREISSGTNP